MPNSVQTRALLFLMEYLETGVCKDPDFFAQYHPPAWSILYWLTRKDIHHGNLSDHHVRTAVTAHTMAMLLHLLDDHMNDGELPASHLLLVIRSQAWVIMQSALKRLSSNIPSGTERVQAFLNEYYRSICSPERVPDVHRYCVLFRSQMATWTMVPCLLASMIRPKTDFADAVRKAYESFGIAWRLLDDIQDAEKDMEKGARTSVYLSLPEELKRCWDELGTSSGKTRARLERILFKHIAEGELIDGLKSRVCEELEMAASITDSKGMRGLSEEFTSLALPLGSESRR